MGQRELCRVTHRHGGQVDKEHVGARDATGAMTDWPGNQVDFGPDFLARSPVS